MEERCCAALRGKLTSAEAARKPSQPYLHDPILMDVGIAATAASFRGLGRNKGVGRDGLAAEVLVTGSDAVALLRSSANQRVVANY